MFKANVDVSIGDDEYIKKTWKSLNLEWRDQWGNLCADRRIILKRILEFEGVDWIQLDRDRVHGDS